MITKKKRLQNMENISYKTEINVTSYRDENNR